jgi:hypothetical protein
VAAWPLAVNAQQPVKLWRIGMLETNIFGSKCAPARRLPATASAARLCRGDKLCYRIPFG